MKLLFCAFICFSVTFSLICIPDCINGICSSNGTCICNENYTQLFDNYCEPSCNPSCQFGKCFRPNECACERGYRKSAGHWNICEAVTNITASELPTTIKKTLTSDSALRKSTTAGSSISNHTSSAGKHLEYKDFKVLIGVVGLAVLTIASLLFVTCIYLICKGCCEYPFYRKHVYNPQILGKLFINFFYIFLNNIFLERRHRTEAFEMKDNMMLDR